MRLVRGLGIAGAVLMGSVLSFGTATFTAQVAYAQTVNDIVVQGNRRVEASTIRAYFRPGPNGRLGPFEIDQGIKALYATGLFEDIRISRAGGRLIITVVENPVINRIAFEGNRKIKDEQIKLEVQSKERGTLSRPLVQADVQRIVEIYRRTGRFNVQVTPKIIDLPNGRVDLVFEINEGDKVGVKAIRFVGNNAFAGYRLKEVIKTVETGLLAFLQTTDIYDPDRLEADRDLLRRFYLKHGYIDVRIVSVVGEYDPTRDGFVITFTIEEGERYRFGAVDVQSNVRTLDPARLRARIWTSAGNIYNAEAVEKSVEEMTIEAARLGFAFVSVRPRAERNLQNRTINIIYFVEEGARVYIERINIRGNTRTRDYVIRREFDIAEGDAYNRALISRAERRLKNLNYFKTVKISNEPGSAPDRIIINVVVEEMSTGEFSVAGGYSTSDGFLGEITLAERNLLGRGQYIKAGVQYGQYKQGYTFTFVEPYFLGYRMALGIDLFSRYNRASSFVSYDTQSIGGSIRLGFALREDLTLQTRYSAYTQKITLPSHLNNCNNLTPDWVTTFPTPSAVTSTPGLITTPPDGYSGIPNCFFDGEASLPVRRELAQGTVLTSLVGYTLAYNTLDNNKNPTSGIYAALTQDFAGVGGDVSFIRSTGDFRTYYEVVTDVVAMFRLQGGHIAGWGSKDLRMLDHFQLGPALVRGFAPAGIGPRDLTPLTAQDALGGTLYWGATVEFQMPLYFLPKDTGIRVAAFADAGSLWNYQGPTSWLPPVPGATGEFLMPSSNAMFVNSSVGVGLVWDSPFGPLRFDFAYPLTKQGFDRTQYFRFGGGTSF
jgi:outer membrane protein insertion porin family